MNRQEWVESGKSRKPLVVREAFSQWKKENNYTCRCVIHHRDDTDDCCRYNEAHYELWGLNLDGSFEYGKYVIFMTASEHIRYHNTGKVFSEEHRHNLSKSHMGRKGVNNGKKFSDETRRKMSESRKGQRRSEEFRQRTSAFQKYVSSLYNIYKLNGGLLKYHPFRSALSKGEIPQEELQYG